MQSNARPSCSRYVAAVEAGDEAALRELFAEDATWTLAAGDLPIAGHLAWAARRSSSEFLAVAHGPLASRAPMRLEITGMIGEGDTGRPAVDEPRPHAPGAGLRERAASGVFTVRDGRIQAVREYMDTLYAGDVAFPDVLAAAA